MKGASFSLKEPWETRKLAQKRQKSIENYSPIQNVDPLSRDLIYVGDSKSDPDKSPPGQNQLMFKIFCHLKAFHLLKF